MGEHPLPSTGQPVDNGEQQGTTTFSSSTVAEPYDRHSSIIDPVNDLDVETDDIKSIADFLAKPVSVASGTFTSANTWGSSLYSGSILTLINAQAIWLNKLQGFLNFRGDVKLRLVINPTPFQQGLLRLTYFPCANQMVDSYRSHMFNRMTISQLPGAYLNLTDNFCEVTVPYLSPTTFLERDQVSTGAYADWGNIDITVMEIFRTGTGPATVNWTLWMSIENLELSGMVQPQMNFEPQMARSKRPTRQLSTIDEEANSGKGPIARIMSTGATLASQLSSIPSLAPVTKPATWVLSALSSAAEALGWSKPTLSEGPMLVSRNLHWFMNNTDGNDTCAPLSLRTDNRISAITDASPGSLDEMSFNFIKTRWSYLTDFAWGPLATAGSVLFAQAVNPVNLKQTSVVNGQTVSTCVPAASFQEFYSNWRGSFQYRVRLVKTGFHTGTIAVTWTPGKAAIQPTYAQTSYMYRQIIDLQTGSDFVFDLPYLVPQDFNSINEYSGILTIHVVNPLLAPATCSDTIDVFIEVRGGEDLTYVCPKNTYDAIPYVPQMDIEYHPQGVESENSGEATALAMSSRPHNFSSVHHAMIANGEIQLSLLDILKAQHIVRYAPTFSPSNNLGAPCLIPAGQIYAQRWNGVANINAPIGGDLVSFIGSWFAFHRGSERFRFVNLDTAASNINYRAMLVGNYDTVTPMNYFQQATGNTTTWSAILSATDGNRYQTGRYLTVPRDNAGLAVQVPFYSRYRYLLNTWASSTTGTVNAFSNQNAAAIAMTAATGVTMSRSVGDDFQFSFFLGIPPYASASQNLGPFSGIS